MQYNALTQTVNTQNIACLRNWICDKSTGARLIALQNRQLRRRVALGVPPSAALEDQSKMQQLYALSDRLVVVSAYLFELSTIDKNTLRPPLGGR